MKDQPDDQAPPRASPETRPDPHAPDSGHAIEEQYRHFLALASEGLWRFDLGTPVAANLPVHQQAGANTQAVLHFNRADRLESEARSRAAQRQRRLSRGIKWIAVC